jgi:circadian clock protein KaiC
MVSSGIDQLDRLLKTGYPDKSAILVMGPPGTGKEALGYWFMQRGLAEGDFCIYVTRQSVSEVVQDVKAFGANGGKAPLWFARDGGQVRIDLNDLPGLSFNLKETIRRNSDKRIRIVTDILSTLLMLNSPENIYRFLSQLLSEIKQFDTVFLATLEEGMHSTQVQAAMQQLFDGVVELRFYEEGLKVLPLLRIVKMRGIPPDPSYFNFSFARQKVEITAYAH